MSDDITERLYNSQDKDAISDAVEEINNLRNLVETLQKYRDMVSFIANDYHELSYEKAQWQRDDWKKRCRKVIEENWT